jgi:inner membrane protein
LGAAIAGGVACLYALLYAVLLSEDNALLMGALLLFAALCAIMMATRRLDWYEAVDPENAAATEGVS